MTLLRLFDHPEPMIQHQKPGKDQKRLFHHKMNRTWWEVNLSVLDMKRQCNHTEGFDINEKSR